MRTAPGVLCLVLALTCCICIAQEFVSDFEQGDPPTGWALGDNGISTLSQAQAHSGTRSLRIVDPDDTSGSNALGTALTLAEGKHCLVSIWLYLESGDPNGLGVYLNFYDAEGKRMSGASEGSIQRPTMKLGEWTRAQYMIAPPPEAKTVRLWLHTFSTAVVTCSVDDVELRLVEADALGPGVHWQGGELTDEIRKVWPYSVKWEHGKSAALARNYEQPADWSMYGGLRMQVYSQQANDASFMVIINSENEQSEGADYYSFKVVLNWEGWREFVLPLHELGRAREPIGWQRIDNVRFTATGWEQELKPETVVYLDGFELIEKVEVAGGVTDEEFFASLNLELPGLATVKAAVEAADMAAARQAFADYLRARETPRWTIDWRERPMKGVRMPGPEDDLAPDQWDYYSTFLTIDWQGWKKIRLTKEELSPQGYVEGKGWQGKRPIGWHWIAYIAINASGWGLTPDPRSVLYFDDVRLVGKDKSLTIADFEGETSPWTGLDLSTEQVKEGRAAGKWANPVANHHTRIDTIPHDWTEYDAIEFWVYSEQATGSRVVLVFDSDVPRDVAGAEKALRREFSYTQGPGQTGTIVFEERMDWTANPTEGEARTHLWNESINRHFHFNQLSQAYWNTGQEKYAAEIAAQILDWTSTMPRPLLSSGNNVGHYAWQTLTTGIRLATTWPDALYRCLDSEAFTPDVLTAMVKSTGEQARHLMRWPSSGNWLTAESNGLFTAGMLFPEFKEAPEWRATAIERLYRQFDDEVYPDGMEYELAAGYNNWVVNEFAHIVELADLNDLRGELPADFQARIEKMYDYQLYASMPNGAIPGLNDSGNASVVTSLADGFRLFAHRTDFEYVASNRARGTVPEKLSVAFAYSGHHVMRSGWDVDATYLLHDVAPFGYGHQHEDKLHFVLWAHGRQLVLDPGNFSYDRSRWRRYVLATYGHNTVMVDGQGQNRRAKRETYFWPRPWSTPSPAGSDARWFSTAECDYSSGVYSDGYGPKNEVDVHHTRQIIYLKQPNLFIITDALVPADGGQHSYEALFHLDSDEATVAEGDVVSTVNQGQANVSITPMGTSGVQIVKGKEDEPVQGWSNGPWRAIPTAIYATAGAGTVRMAFVLEPVPADGTAKVSSVRMLEGAGDGFGIEVLLADGSRYVVKTLDGDGKPVSVISWGADGKEAGKVEFVPQAP